MINKINGLIETMKKTGLRTSEALKLKKSQLEDGPKAFGRPDIKPEIKVGDWVFVNWANNQTYKGIIKEKLRKNWGVEITDDAWHYSSNQASIPEHALAKRNYK